MNRAALALAILLVADGSAAQDYIRSKGRLSDNDFYRLVACGQPQGGVCTFRLRRWPSDLAHNITVTKLLDIDPVSPIVVAQVSLAIDHAIDTLNATGANIRLRRLPDNAPGRVQLSVRSHATMQLVSNETRPETVPAGLVVFQTDGPSRITGAVIMIDADLPLTQINSVVLEELTQSLGLPYDISNPYYLRRSIFSQDRNSVTVITGQDAAALRQHYPEANR